MSSQSVAVCVLFESSRTPYVLPSPEVVLPMPAPVTVSSFRAFFRDLPARLMTQMALNDAALQIYGDPRFAKTAPGVTPWMPPREILRARSVQEDQKCLTFMATYGSQHKLPEQMLIKQGLHTQLVLTNTSYRYIAPHEMLLMLGITREFQLGFSPAQAWMSVGNAISPLHAAVTFAKLLQLL